MLSLLQAGFAASLMALSLASPYELPLRASNVLILPSADTSRHVPLSSDVSATLLTGLPALSDLVSPLTPLPSPTAVSMPLHERRILPLVASISWNIRVPGAYDS